MRCEKNGEKYDQEEFIKKLKEKKDIKFEGKVKQKQIKIIIRRKSSDILKNYEFRNLKTDKEKIMKIIEKMRSR